MSCGDDPVDDFRNFWGSTFWEFRGLGKPVFRRRSRRWLYELLGIDFSRILRSQKTGRSETISEMTFGTFGDWLFRNFEINHRRWNLSGDVRCSMLTFQYYYFPKVKSECAGACGFTFTKNMMRRSNLVFNDIVRTSPLSFRRRKLISNLKKRWSPKVSKIISGVVFERPNFRDLELLK